MLEACVVRLEHQIGLAALQSQIVSREHPPLPPPPPAPPPFELHPFLGIPFSWPALHATLPLLASHGCLPAMLPLLALPTLFPTAPPPGTPPSPSLCPSPAPRETLP